MSLRSDHNDPAQKLPFARTALWIGGAFLFCLLAVAIFTVADFASGTNRERFSETTAAGDVKYFAPAANVNASFTWAGREYTLLSQEKVKIDDTDMVRMAQDEVGGFAVYSRRSHPGKELFVKIDVGEFLPLRVK